MEAHNEHMGIKTNTPISDKARFLEMMMPNRDDTIRGVLNLGAKPCGSRRIAEKYPNFPLIKIKDDTDFDFYIENSKHNITKLTEMGFESCNHPKEYCDDLATDVMVHNKYKDVEVVLRIRVPTFEKIFESLSPEEYTHYVWKRGPILRRMKPAHARKYIRDYINLKAMFWSQAIFDEI